MKKWLILLNIFISCVAHADQYVRGNLGVGTTFTTGGNLLTVINGDVGIGTWGANQLLQVVGGSIGVGTYLACTQKGTECPISAGGGSVTSVTASLPLLSSGGVSPNITVTANPYIQGNVGLGTTTISGTGLDVNGTIQLTALLSSTVVGSDASGKLISQTVKGNSTTVQLNNGTLISGNLIEADANQNTVDSGVSFGTLTDTKTCTYSSGSTSISCNSSGGSGTNYWQLTSVGVGTGMPGNPANVGIGTVTYGSSFDVVGNVGIATVSSSMYVLGTASNGGAMIEGNVGIGTSYVPAGVNMEVEGTLNNTAFYSNGVTCASGFCNVGIGTLAPTAPFQVKGTGTISAYFANNVGIGSTQPNGNLDIEGGNVGIGTAANQAGLAFMDGAVGIGTWTPVSLAVLDVQGTVIVLGHSSSTNVGIGSATPGAALDVQGTIRFDLDKSLTGVRYLCIDSKGTVESQPTACVGT